MTGAIFFVRYIYHSYNGRKRKKRGDNMFTTLWQIIGTLLGLGLAGILIIIGLIALVKGIFKSIIVHLYYAIHHDKRGRD